MTRSVVPFRQVVLKVHSRCDLACDHCYVYEHADQSWRSRPKVMSDRTIQLAAARIAEHAAAHRLPVVHVVLHGGEPLLAGPARLERAAVALRTALAGVCELDLRIQTNGVLLSDEFCELFARFQVKVGISLDGDRAANDRHRRYADGRGSYDQVIRAVTRLRTERYRHLFAGLLCTVDVANDPIATYEALRALEPPRVDFLLPHATWDNPPPRPPGAETPYADWLIPIYEQWTRDGRRISVRVFDSILSTLRGGGSLTEAMGLAPSDLVVVETDGSLEQVDSLKAAYDGAPATGLDLTANSLDDAGRHPGIVARQQGLAGLCDTCQECPVVGSCGGGLYAHRYRSGTGFANPSVFCGDLMKLITHVEDGERPPATRSTSAVERPATSPASAPPTHLPPTHLPPTPARPTDRRPTHVLPAADLDALASGFGGAAAVERLVATQRSLSRGLLAAAYGRAAAHPTTGDHPGPNAEPNAGPEAEFDPRAAWDLLTRIDREDPAALDAVIAHPYVRTWAVSCLQSAAGDLGHLAAVAGAAAIRSGTRARLVLPVRDGAVHLPTLGRLDVGPVGPAMLEVEPAQFTVSAGSGRWVVPTDPTAAGAGPAGIAGPVNLPGPVIIAGGRWRPVRRLAATGLTISLEDTDPYRDCHNWRAAPRLAPGQAAAWQRRFRAAWELIRREHPAYAPGIAAGLTTVTPLRPADPGRGVSATARHAFGAVGVALPARAADLALLLIHEFQHVKMGAVLDLVDLYDGQDRRRFRVPWRADPRPLEGLLQGTYAHVAVTDFWRVHRHTAGDAEAAEVATARFRAARANTAEAVETLVGAADALTPLGQRFVAGMGETLSRWLAESTRSAPVGAAL